MPRYSKTDNFILAFHEAHVEAAEQGSHKIIVSDQPGCKVVDAGHAGKTYRRSEAR